MIDTHVAGQPEDLRAAAAFLTEVLAEALTQVADTAAAERRTLAEGWEGEGGQAFQDRATLLARIADEVAREAAAAGRELERLAATLSQVRLELAAVRAEAATAGLEVRGERILPPAPSSAATVEAYLAAQSRTEACLAHWGQVLATASSWAETNATSLVQATSGLLVSTYTAALRSRVGVVMAAQSDFLNDQSQRLAGYAEELVDHVRSGRLAPYERFYDDYDDLVSRGRQAADDAAKAADVAAKPRLPAGLRGAFALVGPAAAAYGVYDDLQHGESVQQAVVSQGGGLLAGVGAGIAAGAACTALLPGAGTVTCGVAGGIAGAAGGWTGNELMDRRYESGATAAREEAEEQRRRDHERVQQLLNLEAGLPLFSTPGSDRIATPFPRPH